MYTRPAPPWHSLGAAPEADLGGGASLIAGLMVRPQLIRGRRAGRADHRYRCGGLSRAAH